MRSVVTDGTGWLAKGAIGEGRGAEIKHLGVQRTSAMRAIRAARENTAQAAAIGRIRNNPGAGVYSIDELRSSGERLPPVCTKMQRRRRFVAWHPSRLFVAFET